MDIAIDREQLDTLFEALTRHGVDRLEWLVYWYSDEGHINDYWLFDTAGERVQIPMAGDISPEALDNLFWSIIEAYDEQGEGTGLYRLDLKNRTVQRLADAYYDIEVEELPEDTQECIAL